MQHYLITIEIRDGEHEYSHRLLHQCDESTTDIDILKDFTGLDGENDWSLTWCSSWYETPYDYRYCRVGHRQLVTPQDLTVLQKYRL